VVTEQAEPGPSRKVRVAIVDDSPQIRQLLRLFLEADDRFEVVGEGDNGEAAISLVVDTTPDLLILDQQMPGLGGIEALPEIRRRAPRTAVVVYTGETDPVLSGRALAAGALAVLEKVSTGPSVVDRLADILLGHWGAASETDLDLRLGPVPSSVARVWIANTSKIIASLRSHPEVLAVPEEVLDVFEGFLERWRTMAAATEDFYWAARAQAAEVEWLVDWWARIDRMTDDQLAILGVHWSPPEGEPFFRALTASVIDAVSSRREMQSLAAVLASQWTDSDSP
jgi:DNA-binding NarL/FixJ family response regulator